MLKPEDKATLLNASMRFRIGIVLIGSGFILILWRLIPQPLFQNRDVSEIVPVVTEPENPDTYEPIQFDPADIANGIHVPSGMIADTGCAEVVQNCGACHSLELVKQNRATRQGWKDIIVWMQETQKLWDLGLQENVILNYLAKNYGPENSGRRKNLENIEWYKL